MRTLGIVGAGLIGTSVALAARRADPQMRVVTVDRGDGLDAVAGADVIVLATPVDIIIQLLREAHPALRSGVVTDVGSTKHDVIDAARSAGLMQFVAGHPMAGAASSGPAAARGDLFDTRPWFLVPAGAAAPAVETVRRLVERLGARPVLFDDDGRAHDRLMAAVSHVPQVTSSVLMKIVGDAVGAEGLAFAGAGCRDTTRLAASSATMWESVLSTNHTAIAPLLIAMADELRAIAWSLEDGERVRRLFSDANEHRATLERS